MPGGELLHTDTAVVLTASRSPSADTWQPGLSVFGEQLSKFPETPDTGVLEWKANAFLCAVK